MADDLGYTPGAGANIATDDVASRHFQRFKLDLGGDGLTVPAVGTVPVSGSVAATVGTIAQSAVEYNIAAGSRQVSVTASASFAIPTLGASRLMRIATTEACHINFGTSGAVTASVAGTSMPLLATSDLHVIVPAGTTHFAVIRTTADGVVHLTPVA
jgi:hypothetical protein